MLAEIFVSGNVYLGISVFTKEVLPKFLGNKERIWLIGSIKWCYVNRGFGYDYNDLPV